VSQRQRVDADKKTKTAEKRRKDTGKSSEIFEQNRISEIFNAGIVSDNHSSLLLNVRSDTEKAQIALQLQRTYGNAYVRRLFNSHSVQAKLAISQPGDASEQEADRMADAVIQNLDRPVQRQSEEEEEPVQMKVQRQEEEEELQTRVQLQEEGEEVQAKISDSLEDRINAKRGGGHPLSDATRSAIEPQFGHDFSRVRIHTDSESDNLNRELNAQAFATGTDIFFREGKYQPDSHDGQWLIAHELTHVVQQGGSNPLDKSMKCDTWMKNTFPQAAGLQPEVVERAKATFEEKKKTYENFVPGKKKYKNRWSYLAGDKPKQEDGTGPGKEKKVEPPYKMEPLEGMDKLAYDNGMKKFKQMKKPRILGGASKSVRRLEALKYLQETVESSKKYTPYSQMIVNSILQAYKDVFGTELKEDKADEKLGKGEQEKVSTWQKFKEFVSSIFHIKDWINWIKEFIGFCKNPVDAVAEKASTVLPGFLKFAQPIADQVSKWTKWLPIVGVVTSLFSLVKSIPGVISKFFDMRALKSTAREPKKDKESGGELEEAAQYGYAKVKRGFWSRIFGMAKGAGDVVLSVAKLVVGLFSGGIGAIVVQALELSATVIDLAVTAFRKIKGFGKWLLGKRGKARRENAEKIIMAAKQGSVEAAELILKLAPAGMTRGGTLDKLNNWFKYWGANKKAHDKKMLMEILRDWDKKELDALVDGMADKLKSS